MESDAEAGVPPEEEELGGSAASLAEIFMKSELHQRKTPVHLSNLEMHNKPIIVFLTVCTAGKKKVLANEEMHDILQQSWKNAKEWMVGAYIIMPDHIHLFCSPSARESESVAKWVAFWKRAVSCKKPELAPIWQRSCWDRQLRSADSYGDKWKYVEQNPVRGGLVNEVGEWPYKGILNVLRW